MLKPRNGQLEIFGLLLCAVAVTVAQDAKGRNQSSEVQCPQVVNSPEVLTSALGCSLCGCTSVLLSGTGALYRFTPFRPIGGVRLESSWNISGPPSLVLSLDPESGVLELSKDSNLTLEGISVQTNLQATGKDIFLLPMAVAPGSGSNLRLRRLQIFVPQETLARYLVFSAGNLKEDAYEVVEDSSVEPVVQYLRIFSFESDAVTAEDVVVSTLDTPELLEARSMKRLQVHTPQALLRALEIVGSKKNFSKVDIVGDIILQEPLWQYAAVTLRQNVSISGSGAPSLPMLDLSLITSAIVVAPGIHVEMDELELVNLSPGEKRYAAHMWVFLSNRTEQSIVLRNSRLVLSCEELDHFEYAIDTPEDQSIQQAMNVELIDVDRAVGDGDTEVLPGSRLVKLISAEGNGIFFSNVTVVCEPPEQAVILDFHPKLISPQINRTADDRGGGARSRIYPSRGIRRRFQESSDDGQRPNFVIFKIVLALLAPIFLLLGLAFLWRLQRMRALVSEVRSHDASRSIEDKHTSRKGPLEDLPATCSSDRITGQMSNSKLASWDARRNAQSEFVPDIMAVAENIDDKQLVLQELLGQGSSGTVHKGLWRELQVAVKTIIFRGSQRDKHDRQQAAIREVAITSGLTHPNVVCTYSYDVKRLVTTGENSQVAHREMGIWDDFSDFKLYIIQEYCDGGSLRSGLESGCLMDKKYGGPEMEKGLEIASGIARGVHHIHSKNIIHGDLKPNNVLMKMTDRNRSGLIAKIADFGLSLKMRGSQTHVSNVQGGTPFYMAPEVLELESASKAADVYAYGVILWEMYMSHFSSTGVPTPYAISCFPRFPWSCPVLYGVLTIACVQSDPSQRPTFQDILDVLSHMWQQLRQKMMIAPAQSRVSTLGNDAGFDMEDYNVGNAAFVEAMASMPPKFRHITFQTVYWGDKT